MSLNKLSRLELEEDYLRRFLVPSFGIRWTKEALLEKFERVNALALEEYKNNEYISEVIDIYGHISSLDEAKSELYWIGKKVAAVLHETVDVKQPGEVVVPVVGVKGGELECISKASKHSASDFAASNQRLFSGFGMRGHGVYYDPTDVQEDPRTVKLFSMFGSTTDSLMGDGSDAEKQKLYSQWHHRLSRCILVNNDMSKISDTKAGTTDRLGRNRCVQADHMDFVSTAFKSVLRTTGCGDKRELTLQDYNCSMGLVTMGSRPDGFFVDAQGHLRAIWEVKNNTDATCESVRQAAPEGSNVAMMQLELGVPWQDIVVPVIGGNGHLMQFAAVVVLDPSFPTVVMLSSVLDLTDEVDLERATLFLYDISRMVKTRLLTPNPVHVEHMALSRVTYHLKPLRAFFCCAGDMNYQGSLSHYFRVMTRLHRDTNCRPFVVFPICVREYQDCTTETMLVFPNLSEYRIGLPSDETLRAAYLTQVTLALDAIHSAKVVHLDYYLSNIMWREVGEGVEVKVIDWDSAMFIEEEMWEASSMRLSNGPRKDLRNKVARENGIDVADNEKEAVRYYDLSLLRVLETNLDDESLCTADKEELDEAFQAAQHRYLNKA